MHFLLTELRKLKELRELEMNESDRRETTFEEAQEILEAIMDEYEYLEYLENWMQLPQIHGEPEGIFRTRFFQDGQSVWLFFTETEENWEVGKITSSGFLVDKTCFPDWLQAKENFLTRLEEST